MSVRRLLKKYKPENDRGRKGTEFKKCGERTEIRKHEETESRNGSTIGDSNGHEQSKGREFLQKTNVNDDEKVDNSSRKSRFFRRK